MSKLVILGTTHSGKTCYFYGMLRKMMVGVQGFSIRVEEARFNDLRTAIKSLNDTSLPLKERFPKPSDKRETYKLDLLYNFSQMESFDWDDYPGEQMERLQTEFADSMADAHCLFLCVDGEGIAKLADEADDLDLLAEDLIVDWGCFDLNNALAYAEKRNESFPPVCIMITKYDKIPAELRNLDTITEIVQKCFPNLFHSGRGSGKDRLVVICPVTLGKDLDQGARMRPVNVEMPICFATYLIQAATARAYVEQAQNLTAERQREMEEYNNRGFLGRIIHPKPVPLTEEQKRAMEKIIDDKKADADALRCIIEDLPLYLNGEKIAWN